MNDPLATIAVRPLGGRVHLRQAGEEEEKHEHEHQIQHLRSYKAASDYQPTDCCCCNLIFIIFWDGAWMDGKEKQCCCKLLSIDICLISELFPLSVFSFLFSPTPKAGVGSIVVRVRCSFLDAIRQTSLGYFSRGKKTSLETALVIVEKFRRTIPTKLLIVTSFS